MPENRSADNGDDEADKIKRAKRPTSSNRRGSPDEDDNTVRVTTGSPPKKHHKSDDDTPLLSPYHEESGEKEHKRKDDRLHTPAVPSISKDHRDPHPLTGPKNEKEVSRKLDHAFNAPCSYPRTHISEAGEITKPIDTDFHIPGVTRHYHYGLKNHHKEKSPLMEKKSESAHHHSHHNDHDLSLTGSKSNLTMDSSFGSLRSEATSDARNSVGGSDLTVNDSNDDDDDRDSVRTNSASSLIDINVNVPTHSSNTSDADLTNSKQDDLADSDSDDEEERWQNDKKHPLEPPAKKKPTEKK